MQIEKFNAGKFIKQPSGYSAFIPEKINQNYYWSDPELTNLIDKATQRIGQIEAWSQQVPNVDGFIRMYVLKEALDSSRIEGTQTTMHEALLKKRDILPQRKDDWVEVHNYVDAMNHSISQLNSLPLSSRLIRTSHRILMAGARGQHKQPGEFRTSQNWIGGNTLKDAIFIPPPFSSVNDLMGDLDTFLHNPDCGLPNLVKIGLAHYQFETIHPFSDGNGRIGRLLITLYLVEQDILSKPVLYISDFFERKKNQYYSRLMEVRIKGDLMNWIKFFLTGVIETAEDSIRVFKAIIQLKEDCEKKIYKLGKKAPHAKLLLDHLFGIPLIEAEDCSRVTKLSLVSTYRLIEDFQKHKILFEITGFKRNRLFSFQDYYKLFNPSFKKQN